MAGCPHEQMTWDGWHLGLLTMTSEGSTPFQNACAHSSLSAWRYEMEATNLHHTQRVPGRRETDTASHRVALALKATRSKPKQQIPTAHGCTRAPWDP